jgi:hypothetical protein
VQGEVDPFESIHDEAQAREEANKAAALARQVEREDIAWLMSNKRGRRLVWRLLERAGVYRSSFSSDPLAMAKNEGRRETGLMLLADVASEPESVITMMREAAKK